MYICIYIEFLENLLAIFDILNPDQNKIDINNEFDQDKTVDQIIEDVIIENVVLSFSTASIDCSH
jgi:hypothetical protein